MNVEEASPTSVSAPPPPVPGVAMIVRVAHGAGEGEVVLTTRQRNFVFHVPLGRIASLLRPGERVAFMKATLEKNGTIEIHGRAEPDEQWDESGAAPVTLAGLLPAAPRRCACGAPEHKGMCKYALEIEKRAAQREGRTFSEGRT